MMFNDVALMVSLTLMTGNVLRNLTEAHNRADPAF